ncbi:MAG: helix-turn-helix domain-containing protein [Nitrosopumilaceae archaeon]
MLIEIPDPEIIVGVIASFFVGLFALYIIYKIRPLTTQKERYDSSSFERLEFYERQLIDMKIRLDSLEISDEVTPSSEVKNLGRSIQHLPEQDFLSEPKSKYPTSKARQTPTLDNSNTVDFVLKLITNKSMTSRDIQKASHRSREHTSRLMKKLFQDGFVERNTNTKPYVYSITEKGKAKIGILEQMQNVAA